MRWSMVSILKGLAVLGMALAVAPLAAAQPTDGPPAVAAVVGEDPLTAVGALREGGCSNNRNFNRFVEGGHLLRVSGRCSPASTVALASARVHDLILHDGEVRYEMRVTAGWERARHDLWFRDHGAGKGHRVSLVFGEARAELSTLVDNQPRVLAERGDLTDLFDAGGWNSVAIRAQGSNVWLLLNDQPILSAATPAYAPGPIYIDLVRTGPLDDEVESALQVRNLRVSSLVASDPARAPTFRIPSTSLESSPPEVGPVVVESSLTSPGLMAAGACPSGLNGSAFVPDGLRIRVNGRCRDTSTAAQLTKRPEGLLDLPDGEVSVEFRVDGPADRTWLRIYFRDAANVGGYYLTLFPPRGLAQIWRGAAGQSSGLLAERTDLGDVLSQEQWNRVALRIEGASFWLVLNDQAVLSAEDATAAYSNGGLAFDLFRTGPVDDPQEAAVVLRNLRISGLASSDWGRLPTYRAPARAR